MALESGAVLLTPDFVHNLLAIGQYSGMIVHLPSVSGVHNILISCIVASHRSLDSCQRTNVTVIDCVEMQVSRVILTPVSISDIVP